MAKVLFFVVLAVLSISVITEAQFGGSCPPNCRESQCSFMGCVDCDVGFCHSSGDRGQIICVKTCPDGMYCEHTHRMCIN